MAISFNDEEIHKTSAIFVRFKLEKKLLCVLLSLVLVAMAIVFWDSHFILALPGPRFVSFLHEDVRLAWDCSNFASKHTFF